MRHFREHEQEVYALINEGENYIIFNDGKAIRRNIDGNSDDILDITVGESFSCDDICHRKRPADEYDIIKKSKFTNIIHIYKSMNLKVIHINDDEENVNVVYDISEKAVVSIINIYYMIDKKTNALIEISCNDYSKVNYMTYMRASSPLKIKLNCYLDDKSSLEINSLALNINDVDIETNVYLYRPKTSAIINNTIINSTGLKQIYNYNVYHKMKDTKSQLMNYVIANNNSGLDINNKGIIEKGAVNSELSQKSKGLILDMLSSIAANPILLIDENDVIANHGAAIGAIDDDDLYYLMSRGLTKEMGEQLLIKAFINPCLSSIKDEKILLLMNEDIKQKL